ncbi:MAG: ChaN family lipoprotein [Bacteroidales bacterium]|nr:ChaN family lipoprotein [Bacteroidales bacterium]
MSKKSLYQSLRLLFIISIFSCYNLKGQGQDTLYRIYSVKLEKEVSLDYIIKDMKNYDVLFFGEEHDDSAAHYLENKIVEMFYAAFQEKTVLSLEMFSRDVQIVMDEYLKGYIREREFRNDARAWSNYKDYRPMVEFAKKNHFPVICANAPNRYSNMVGRHGPEVLFSLSEESKRYVAHIPYDTATGNYHDKLANFFMETTMNKTDSGMPKAMGMPTFNFIAAQSLWDATMAYSIANQLSANKNSKIFHVNGRFHSDEGYAVVTQLKKYSPTTKTLIISSGSDDSFPSIDWKQFIHLGDYIIITNPKLERSY